MANEFKGKWIKVSDGMPTNVEGYYLVKCIIKPYDLKWVAVARISPDPDDKDGKWPYAWEYAANRLKDKLIDYFIFNDLDIPDHVIEDTEIEVIEWQEVKRNDN